jgi:hypothetical protein
MSDTTTENVNTINTGLGSIATNSYDVMNSLLTNPSIIIILAIVLGLYFVLVMYLGDNVFPSSSEDSVSNSGSNTIAILFVAFFAILIIINGLQYFFGVDIIAQLKNLFTGNPEVDIIVDKSRLDIAKESTVPQIFLKKQVFNIPENDFVYPDAKALCKAYGARLATYEEVEDSYNKGAEWCNYGWSEGQMALFPTQQKTFDKLQKIEGHENDCGRPGVNGGYIANPALKFGVNCYGYKPRMTKEEEELMANKQIYPKTLKDKAMENRVKYWKDKLTEILVSPFNQTSWSKL